MWNPDLKIKSQVGAVFTTTSGRNSADALVLRVQSGLGFKGLEASV